MSDQWMSTREAAELLGVSQRTIQNWVDDGKLQASLTVGGHRRLNPRDVQNFLQNSHFPNVHANAPVLSQDTPAMASPEKEMLRVLVVEDDCTILRLCELRFAQYSVPHHLYLASNGYQGLFMAGRHLPHLIFTDLKMPHLDGLQMIREIIKLPEMQQTRIVVVTGIETREIMKMGSLPEGVMVLPKPIPFNTVETIMYQQAHTLNLSLNHNDGEG